MIKNTMVKWNFYMPHNLIASIAKQAEIEGVSSADIIRVAVREYLKRAKRKEAK